MFRFDANAFASPVAQHDHTELVNEIADRVVRRRMAMPAILLIESFKPLNRLASQAILVVSPLLALLVPCEKIDAFSDMLQDRAWVEKLVREIESREDKRHRTAEM